MQLISEGAEAKIYSTNFLGAEAIVKDRIKKNYRISAIDEQIREQRTRREAKILYLSSMNGLMVPKVLLLSSTTIFMEMVHGKVLHSMIDNSTTTKRYISIMNEAGRNLGVLHNLNIAHGDYTPANLMLDKNGNVWIIDFGLSEITLSIEEKALDLLLMKRSISKVFFASFMRGYSSASKQQKEITKRLSDIEKRGRYQTRTLMTG